MTEESYPDWLPDWRDPTLYPDPKSTSRKQWAWEFLRRNETYQAEWIVKDASKYSVHYSTVEQDTDYKNQCMFLLGCEWGLACVAPDPANDTPKPLAFLSSVRIGAVTYEDVQTYGQIPFSSNDWPVVGVIFNLEASIRSQIDEAEKFLNATKARFEDEGKISPKEYRFPKGELLKTYLRCLDGKRVGVSVKEIAKVLFPSIKNKYPDYRADNRVKDSLKAAEELVDSKYRNFTSADKGK
jgi:hypothetical protein